MARTVKDVNALLDKLEEFMNSYKEADDKFMHDQKRKDWDAKYSERLEPYKEKIARLNGDDFDLMEESMNEYEKDYSDMSSDEYMDALENNIKATLARVWPEGTEEQIEQVAKETAEQVVETDADADAEAEVETNAEAETNADADDDDDVDPEADFIAQLEIEKARMPKRKNDDEE